MTFGPTTAGEQAAVLQSAEGAQGRQEGAEGSPALPKWVQESLERMTGLDKRLQVGSPALRPFEEVGPLVILLDAFLARVRLYYCQHKIILS